MKPQKPVVPPPPGTKKADEQRLAEADLLDAFLCIQEVCQLGLARCVTLAGVGIVNIVTSLDHEAMCDKHAVKPDGDEAELAWEAEMAECADCKAIPRKPVIRRYAAINHYEGFLAAGVASYNQIAHLAQDSTDEKLKALALKFIERLKEIRERRTKRIITQGLTA